MQTAFEVSEQVRTVLRIEDVQNEAAVILKILKPFDDVFAPLIVVYLMRKSLVSILFKHPLEQIINIIKMIIEGLTVYAALLNKVLDGYFVDRFYRQHFLQGIPQCLFC